MLNWVWGLMMACPLLYSCVLRQPQQVSSSLLKSGTAAVNLCLKMAGGFMLWCGLIEILKRGGAVEKLSRRMAPALQKLFSGQLGPEALAAITLNLTANMLGLGNAATPAGLQAMTLMAEQKAPQRAFYMFLVLNSCCLQLLPSTVLTLRSAAGSAQPGAIIFPTIVSTLVTVATGVSLCCWWGRKQRD